MSIFSDVPEIVEAENLLCLLVKRKFDEIAENDAEEIFEKLVDELGKKDVCKDPDSAIEYAEDEGWIWQAADTHLTYDSDNEVVRLCKCAGNEMDEQEAAILARQDICTNGKDAGWAVDANYAYEAWKAEIKKKLRELIKKKCG